MYMFMTYTSYQDDHSLEVAMKIKSQKDNKQL